MAPRAPQLVMPWHASSTPPEEGPVLAADQVPDAPPLAPGEQYFGVRVPAIEALPGEYQAQFYNWMSIIHTPQHDAAASLDVGNWLCCATGQVASLAHALQA